MLGFFRQLIHSKVGAIIGLLFLGAIALAFAAGDIKNLAQGTLSGSGGDAAKVGGASLSANDVQSRVQRVFEGNRRNQPELTISQFLSVGGLQNVLEQLIDGLAITRFAQDNGMRVSKKLVDAEIASIPAFQDATGKFSQTTFTQLIQREHIPEKDLRDDIAQQILRRQIVSPTGAGAATPHGMILPYASMLLEQRAGTAAVLPSLAFLPRNRPNEAQVRAFYAGHSDAFSLPEQRRVRYAVIEASRFAAQTKPSEAEIAAYYRANAAKYAASETRTVQQLILPSEAKAKEIAAKAASVPLDKAAQAAGLATSSIGPVDRAGLAGQVGDPAVAPVFAAAKGAVVGPVHTGLGWALFSVTAVNAVPARSLESARAEIVAALTTEKTKQAMAEFAAKIDDQIGDGATFDQIVKTQGLTATETPMLTREGKPVGAPPQQQPDPAVMPLVTAGYTMEQGDDPQMIPLVSDQTRMALVALGQVAPAGPPPLAQIRPAVERGWALQQGALKAKAAAEALRAKLAVGTPLATALAGVGVALPPPEHVAAQRAQLGQQGQRVPEVMVALFSMLKGKARIIPLPQDQGYAIIQLDEVVPGNAAGNRQVLDATREGLIPVLAEEYGRQFQAAIRAQVGVQRNDAVLARIQGDLRRGGGSQ